MPGEIEEAVDTIRSLGILVDHWADIGGEVEIGHAALVGLPAAAGALAGSAWQQRIRTSTLTYGFAALLTVLGVWLLAS